ncbi:MAG: haloacid dehalogenase-like hydrolase [Bacillus sp. (in: Bacteria)]|nr:haloacid dehalogenase-like hydrolase [Bacillus sp. (in: firmicutes)]
MVTVDFDGTLYQGNSFKVMFQFGRKSFGPKEWAIVFVGVMKSLIVGMLKGKNALRIEFFKAFGRTFKGKTEEELDDFFDELVQMGKKDVNYDLVLKILEHQRNGDTVIILSGALHPFLKAFTKELELDVHVISTTLIFDEKGFCTGELGEIINGQEKVKQIQAWLEHQGATSPLDVWAYADSESDIPLFQYAEHPVVVNPDSDMKKIAEENKWPIFAS